jgi:hypothetical protein
MNRIPVESSVLASVLYLPERCILEVEFRSGPARPTNTLTFRSKATTSF